MTPPTPLHSAPPLWSTAAAARAAGVRPTETRTLGAHLHECQARHGRLFALQCGGEALRGFLASRLVTTTLLAVLLVVALASIG